MTQKITFFHTADIHFGVENYGRIDAATGIHTRLLDFEKALSTMIDAAIAQKVDLFVFAGDAYKTPYPTPTQQKLLLNQWFRLQEHNIPMVIVVGNHDHPLSFGRAHALDVFGNIRHDGFYVFGKPGVVTIKTKSGPVQVVGIPWPMRTNVMAKEAHQLKSAEDITGYLSERVGSLISQFAAELDPNLPSIFAGHLTVTTGVFSGSEKRAVFGTDPVFMPSQLAIPPFDYVALGHLHRYQNLNESGNCPVVYSGSPERVDFGERKEPKGYCTVTIEADAGVKKTRHSFVELPVRPMHQIEVHLKPEVDFTEQLLAAIAQYQLEGAIIKIVYHLPKGKTDLVDLSAIQKACKPAHYVTGIVPVHQVQERTQRATLSTRMSTEQLVYKYLQTQDIDDTDRQRLLHKALTLVQDFEQEQEKGDEGGKE
ncbi:MAG: exonuclease SbcCD subunit D [Candidatus Dependentiae bacterium]|jgi:exonuclease SbcD